MPHEFLSLECMGQVTSCEGFCGEDASAGWDMRPDHLRSHSTLRFCQSIN